MKKLLILCLGFLLSLSVFGKNREFNPAMWDEMVTNHILDELRDAGYTVLPEIVIVAERTQDTIRKDFRHPRGPVALNDTLKKEFPGREFKGRPEFQKPQFRGEFRGRSERPEFQGREFKGRPEFGLRGNMKRGEMKMRKMDCPCIEKKLMAPVKSPKA